MLVRCQCAGHSEDGHVATAQAQISNFKVAIELYRMDNGFYPAFLQDLVEKPSTPPIPKKWSLYLHEIPRDPWGNKYVYVPPSSHSPYDIYSQGADRDHAWDDIHLREVELPPPPTGQGPPGPPALNGLGLLVHRIQRTLHP